MKILTISASQILIARSDFICIDLFVLQRDDFWRNGIFIEDKAPFITAVFM